MGKNTLPKSNDPVNETSNFEDGWKMSFLLGQKAYFQGRLLLVDRSVIFLNDCEIENHGGAPLADLCSCQGKMMIMAIQPTPA